MRPWKTFYRLLGIPLHGGAPSHYQLLDLSPEQCTPQAVDNALALRKRQLRQNIPSPEFLAPIARFEHEHLEPAAAVLRDPARRATYDRRLQKHRRLLHHQDSKLQRQSLVARANQCLHAALNLDGTLDDNKRAALIDQLTGIGVSVAQAHTVVDRLPAPSPRLARLGATHLQQLTNRFLQLLTTTCPKGQISRQQYVAFVAQAIHMGLPAASAHRLLNAHQNRAATPEPLAEADLFTEPEPTPLPTSATPASVDLAVTGRSSVLARHRRLLAVLAIALLAVLLAVFFFAQPAPTATHAPHAPAPGTPAQYSPDPDPPADTESPDAPAPPNADQNTLARPAPSARDGDTADPEPAPESADTAVKAPYQLPVPPLSRLPRLDDFRRVYANPRLPADKLADVTLALLASADCASRLANRPDAHPGLLASVLDAPYPTDELIGTVRLTQDALPAASASNALPPPLVADLRNQLQHPNRPVRYRAIEELRLANSTHAARVLLDALASAPAPDERTTARILNALRTIPDYNTPIRLLHILSQTRRRGLAHLIVRALLHANRMPDYGPGESDAALPLRYSAPRLAASVDWWCRYYGLSAGQLDPDQHAGPASNASAKIIPWPAVKPTTSQPLAQPQQTLLALTAAAAEYARYTATHLQTVNWNPDTLAPSPAAAKTDPPQADARDPRGPQQDNLVQTPDLSERLVASLAAVTDQCLHLVRLHHAAARFATKADLIELARHRRLAQAQIPLHRALAETHATGDLLNLLLQLTAAARLPGDTCDDTRPPADADLLDQLRHACYRNLALWELLTRQDAPALQPDADVKDEYKKTYTGQSLCCLGVAPTANPLNIDALDHLATLRRRQQQDRLGALNELAAALDAYRGGFCYSLAHWDPNAPHAPYTAQFAQAFLPVPLASLTDDARHAAQAPLCPNCGNTRRTDCRSCRGTGQLRCPTCRGRGTDAPRQSPPAAPTAAMRQPRWQPCPNCKGRGLISCDRCDRRGTQPCPRCQAPPPPRLSPQLIGQILKLNATVDYLRAGGPDVYSTVGLAPVRLDTPLPPAHTKPSPSRSARPQ